jgi:hypothetical protein
MRLQVFSVIKSSTASFLINTIQQFMVAQIWKGTGLHMRFWFAEKLLFCIDTLQIGPPLWSSGESSRLQNGDVLCFLWGTNWIYICYIEGSRPSLWSSGQNSWLQNGDILCSLWGTNWIYICYSSCEFGIEPSGSMKCWETIELPNI